MAVLWQLPQTGVFLFCKFKRVERAIEAEKLTMSSSSYTKWRKTGLNCEIRSERYGHKKKVASCEDESAETWQTCSSPLMPYSTIVRVCRLLRFSIRNAQKQTHISVPRNKGNALRFRPDTEGHRKIGESKMGLLSWLRLIFHQVYAICSCL